MEEKKEMNQEQYHELYLNALKYVWNIMNFEGEFSEEEFNKHVDENRTKDASTIYTDFSDEQLNINYEHLIRGYGNFGTEFLRKTLEQDPESLLVMMESMTQQLLDLQQAIQESQQYLEQALKEKLESESKTSNE